MGWVKAVSYTHLDVYKRQAQCKCSKKYEIEDEKVVKYIPAEKNVYTFRWSEYQNGKLVTVMSGKQ